MAISMLSPLIVVLLPVAGVAIGFFISVLGGGGGIFYVLILAGLFRLPMTVAVSSSLATIIPTTLAGFSSHYRQGNIRLATAGWVMLGAVAGSLTGAYLTSLIQEAILSKIFGLFLFVMLIPMLCRQRKSRRVEAAAGNEAVPDGAGDPLPSGEADARQPAVAGNKADREASWAYRLVAAAFGLAGGTMSGMLGVSGSPPIIAGLYALGLKAKEVVGTSLLVLLAIGVAGLAGHLALGQVDWTVVILLGSGTVTGAILGPVLLRNVSSQALDKFYGPVFVAMIAVFGVIMLLK